MDCIIESSFVATEAPFAACHAATICQAEDRLLCAFFAGAREGHPDVTIWLATHRRSAWEDLRRVARGRSNAGSALPCWNPVLFQTPDGVTLLFYKVGPDPASWWGYVAESCDAGETWSPPRRLPDGISGPIKNKPIRMSDGTLLCPTSDEAAGWQVFLQETPDLGHTWTSLGPLNDASLIAAIQPTILPFPPGRMLLLCRTRQGFIASCWSADDGQTWGVMELTCLPNPNSGIDACMLNDGRALLVYNHVGMIAGRWGGPRSPLNIAISEDGITWSAALVLESEPGEYSYPSAIQSSDGHVHIVYTWRRTNIRHVVLDPAKLDLAPMRSGLWPSSLPKDRQGGTDQPY